MSKKKPSWFERHRKTTIVLVNLVILLVVLLIFEVILRFYISYNPGYYVSIDTKDSELVYPWGKVPINKHGYPDEEFKIGAKPRIGYYGDSVTFGVGAGYGNRITEFLEKAYPKYDHWNFAGIGEALTPDMIKTLSKEFNEFKLSHVVYLFNLNDIIPAPQTEDEQQDPGANVRPLHKFVVQNLDWLRGRSYLYNFVRTRIKNYMTVKGFEASGYVASELYPHKYEDVVKQTANRINKMNKVLEESNIKFHVVLLPYEMQISDDAARTYRDLRITWEDGFLDGSTQKLISRYIDKEVPVYNAYYAFVKPGREAESKANIKVGEYFVYNKGDKMDWNHPLGNGHRLISDYLIKQNIFE